MQIDENEPLGQYLLARADETGEPIAEVAKAESAASILARVRMLHERYMNGEFSQGYMADQLGIERIDMIHLLDSMGLPSANI
ncbi:MAG: hypothetical protein HS103_06290 [Anaerolineales bacterium]|nr:hypothetical protein [Anaerolineales bacterium]